MTVQNLTTALDKVTNANINTAAQSDETWTLDAVGNWTSSASAAGTGTSTAPSLTSTSHTNNSRNELTAVGSNSMAQNNDGATTTDSDGYHYVYDAWGHIISTTNASSASNSSYAYDALGREMIDSTYCTWSSSYIPHDLYYSQQGQVIEDQSSYTGYACSYCGCGPTVHGGAGSVCGTYYCVCTVAYDDQFVWSNGYVDDLVLRDEVNNSTYIFSFTPTGYSNYVDGTYNAGGRATGRLFVQQDADHTVTSLVNSSGTVQERFVYDPYGSRQVLTTSWTSTTDSNYWIYGFQGGRMDPATGLIRFGVRDYSPSDGRWVEPDPDGYIDGLNVYQGFEGNPIFYSDPSGYYAAGTPPMDLPPIPPTPRPLSIPLVLPPPLPANGQPPPPMHPRPQPPQPGQPVQKDPKTPFEKATAKLQQAKNDVADQEACVTALHKQLLQITDTDAIKKTMEQIKAAEKKWDELRAKQTQANDEWDATPAPPTPTPGPGL